MGNVFDLLEAEWRRLRHDRSAARLLEGACRLAGEARTLEELERFVRSAPPAGSDAVLLELVTGATTGDDAATRDTAARVLLQLLLPGTRNLARRWWALGDGEERAAAAVAAVYRRIRQYPLQRRPGRVAANVLMDAAHELRRSLPRVVTTPLADPSVAVARPWTAGPVPAANPAAELGEVLSEAIVDGRISRADAELIARSRIAGHRIADMAQSQGLRPRTLWDRRQRAESTLAGA